MSCSGGACAVMWPRRFAMNNFHALLQGDLPRSELDFCVFVGPFYLPQIFFRDLQQDDTMDLLSLCACDEFFDANAKDNESIFFLL